jgi:hypothetical protein
VVWNVEEYFVYSTNYYDASGQPAHRLHLFVVGWHISRQGVARSIRQGCGPLTNRILAMKISTASHRALAI